ncbi:MAG: hypothetical protein D6706_14950 [Chloroflexi bacterium]|nr:MAG: hypothetical protein D6706_14950 [Chloroflexota bacterium]
MALAHIVNGSFDGSAYKIKVLGGSIIKRYATREVSGAGDAETGSVFTSGRMEHIVNASGVYTPDSGTSYPLPVVGSPITGSPLFRLSRLRLNLNQRLRNITGAEDAFPYSTYQAGRPIITGGGFGWAKDDDAIMSDMSSTSGEVGSFDVTINPSGPVKFEAAIKITNYNIQIPFRDGGATPVVFQFVVNDITPVITNTPFSGASSGFTTDLNTSEARYQGTVIPYQVQMDVDFENLVPTVIAVSGPFSGAITVTT